MTRINTNIGSLNAQKSLQWTNAQLQQALNRLSTGLRINSGKDDPAGLIASEILRSDIVSTQKAISNSERANQMIATADSALGQISLLLHDIRGLVEEAANAGAMSDEQIAANQLQIDAALQSINRVAQTTKFQGRGLLDGTLDFVTNSATIPDIKDLTINQATIGATGQINVNTEILTAATQASIRSASGDAMGVAALRFAPRTTLVLNGAGTSTLSITAMTAGPQMEGVKVTLTDTGTAGATYNPETKVLALTYNAGATTAAALATKINDIPAGGLPDLFYAAGDAVAADAVVSGGDTLVAPQLVFTAKTAGIDFNNVNVKVQTGAADGAAWNAGAKEILLTLGNANATLDAIKTTVAGSAISSLFDVTAVAGGSGTAATTNMYGLSQTALETKPVTNSTITGYLRSGFSAATQAMATLSFAPVAAAGLRTDIASTSVALLTSVTTATIDIQSDGAGEGVSIVWDGSSAGALGTETATYNAGAKTLTILYNDTTSTVASIVAAINAEATGKWSARNTEPLKDLETVDASATQPSATTVSVDDTATIDIQSKSLELGKDVLISFVDDNSVTKGNEYAVYNSAGKTLDVHYDGGASTVADLVTAVNKLDGWIATNSRSVFTASAPLTTSTGAGDATLTIQSLLGKGSGVTVSFENTGAPVTPYAVYDDAARTLKVYFQTTVDTVNEVLTAINALDGWTASATFTAGNATNTVTSGANATATAATTDADTVFATGQTAIKTVVDKLQVASLNPGANYNNMQVRFEGKIGLVTPIASYDAVKNEMVIQVDTASTVNSSFAKIVTAINGVQAGGVAGGFSANWITPTNGLNYIYGSRVDVNAVGNTASSGGNTLLADLVIEVAGATGSEAFNFGAGTSANQIANAFNLVSDSTGIWAAQDNGLLSIKSNGYGSKYFTAANVTNEGIAGTLKTALSASRATGADANAKINGITAVADGNMLSVATSTLDMSIEVAAGKVISFNFAITGGGALFQLGPDVVANQQARMGIQSVNTTRLGGASGRLYQLGNGLTASLINNVGLAAKIADDAVTSIINLRGRLGAFQKTTLDTNIKALSDTVVALTEAESSIRDADFATETANLTRAQILTQSGMAVLGIANQQPQNVLALLRNL